MSSTHEFYSADEEPPGSHVHTYLGQSLAHSHEHGGPHGYYEHAEDGPAHGDWSVTPNGTLGRDFCRPTS